MTTYPTDLSNNQWQTISKNFDTEQKRKYDFRDFTNGILYLIKIGCQWRMLPSDFAHWKIVYSYFSSCKKKGIGEDIHESWIEKVRVLHDKNEEPTVGIIDAQSVKNTLASSQYNGFDASKKMKSIKRHIIVDMLEMIIVVVIQGASVQDRDGATDVIKKMTGSWRKIIKVFADGGFRGELN